MKFESYSRILKAAFFTPIGKHVHTGEIDWGLKIVKRGPPGASKTATTRALARELNIPYVSVKPGAKGEGFFGVIGVPENNMISFPAPRWAEELKDTCAIVDLDEINTAPPLIQSSMLGMLQEKEIGSSHLGPRVRLFASTNETEDAAGGWDLAPAISNRLGHLEWPDPDINIWSNHMSSISSNLLNEPTNKERYASVIAIERSVLEQHPLAWAKASGIITGFLKVRPNLLRNQPDSTNPDSSKAWCSPRTWEYACHALTSSMIHGLSEEETETFIECFVGTAAQSELSIWMHEQDLVDPLELLSGTVTFKHNPQRLDKTFTTLASCLSLVLSSEEGVQKERSNVLWGVLGEVAKDASDIIVPTAQTLLEKGLIPPNAVATLASINAVTSALK